MATRTVPTREAVEYFKMGLSDGAEEFRWDFGNVPHLAGLLANQLTTAFLHSQCGEHDGANETPAAVDCAETFLVLFDEMQRIKKRIEDK